MAKAPRELRIVYGSYEVAATEGREPDDLISYDENQDNGFFEFSFIIHNADRDTFVASATAAEVAFRTPRQDLEVFFGVKSILSRKQSANTGLNARPRITKQRDLGDSGRSRRYSIRIDYDLPADVHGTDGRRNARVDISYSPNRRRTVTISGTYTALAGNGARAQYEASITTYATSITNPLGIFEITNESAEADDQDKLLDFRIIYEEVRSAQSAAGAPDDPQIIKHTLRIALITPAPGDAPVTERLSQIKVSYTAWVENGVDPISKYTSSLREFLIERALTKYGASNGALTQENPDSDDAENALTVNMTIAAPLGTATTRIESTQSVELVIETGLAVAPAWTGNPLSYHTWQGPERRVRTVTNKDRFLGNARVARAGAIAAGGVLPRLGEEPGGFFLTISTREVITPIRLGTPDRFIDTTEVTEISVEQFIVPIARRRVDPTAQARGRRRGQQDNKGEGGRKAQQGDAAGGDLPL